MDYQFWGFLLTHGSSAIWIGLTIYQIRLAQRAQPAAKRGKKAVSVGVDWKAYIPVALIALIAASVWIPYLGMEPPAIPDDVVTAYNNRSPGNITALIVRGDRILEYADDYKMVGVVFIPELLSDPLDASGLQKSARYDIRDEQIPVNISLNDELFPRGQRMRVAFALLLVPNGVDVDSFSTLRQAIALGAIVAWDAGGMLTA